MNTKTLVQICTLLLWTLLVGCTLHFKAKDIEVDTESKDIGVIGSPGTNHTYELAKVDIFKNASPENTRSP